MRFIKRNLKMIIPFILGIIIASGVSVYATSQYLASQIDYNKNGQEKVSDALDDLYLNKKVTSDENTNIVANGQQILDKYYKNLNVNVQNPINAPQLIASDIKTENCLPDYTYTCTDTGKMMITIYTAKGKDGTRGTKFSCKKNNAELTNYTQNNPNGWVLMRCYIVDVNINDVIKISLNSTGSYGDSGYSIFFIKQ